MQLVKDTSAKLKAVSESDHKLILMQLFLIFSFNDFVIAVIVSLEVLILRNCDLFA